MEKLDFIDSKFRLAILAAKRAKQLVGGAKKKVERTAENPLTIALEEIYSGKINFQVIAKDSIDLVKEDADRISPSRFLSGNDSSVDMFFSEEGSSVESDTDENDDEETA